MNKDREFCMGMRDPVNSGITDTDRLSIGQFIKTGLTTPLSVFGNVSAIEYGEKHGWEYVWATLSRMYGPMPSLKDTDRLEWMIEQSILAKGKLLLVAGASYFFNDVPGFYITPREAIDAAMKESKE